jgi:hypothetical protein
MSSGVWEEEFSEARQRLLESNDFLILRSRGHDLNNGVVVTSVSDVPFEVSLKCIYCGIVFWFENAEWSIGGIAKWRVNSISLQESGSICPALVYSSSV